jgi:hypothetical protein
MTELYDKIYWAINKFNKEIEAGKKDARDCLGLLGYIRKICPDKDFPVWARHSLTSDAVEAAYRAAFTF